MGPSSAAFPPPWFHSPQFSPVHGIPYQINFLQASLCLGRFSTGYGGMGGDTHIMIVRQVAQEIRFLRTILEVDHSLVRWHRDPTP